MGRYLCLMFLVGCIASKSIVCEQGTANERLCPESAACDNTHHTCVEPSQLTSCAGDTDGTACMFNDTAGLCRDQVCLAEGCGDGFVRGDEKCDGTDLGSAHDCRDLGYYDASPLSCNSACAYDTSQCLGFCGDGEVTPGFELCDGAPPAESCVDLGYGAGFLTCDLCGPGLSDCEFFGWHQPRFAAGFLTAMGGTSDTNVYAVGLADTVVRYDGTDWVPVDLSACLGDADLTAVHVVGDGELWIGGSTQAGQPIVAHVTPNGCTATMPASSQSVIEGIWATSPTDVWAADNIDIYHFDGTWHLALAFPATHVWASGPSDVYAIGSSTQLKHWDGLTWTSIFGFAPTQSTEVLWGTSATDVYLGGTATNGAMLQHYDGAIWTSIMPNFAFVDITSVAIANGRIFAGGRNDFSSTLLYAYDGAAWTDLQITNAGGATGGIVATASGKVYACTNGPELLRYEGAIRIDDVLSSPFVHVAAHSGSDAYGVDENNDVVAWDGLAWTVDTGLAGAQDISVDASGNAFAVSSTTGLVQRTGANMWSTLDASASGSLMLWAASPTDIWWLDADEATLQHWNGAPTSVCATCTTPGGIQTLWGQSSTDIFAGGSGGLIVHWNGLTWTTMTSNLSGNLVAIRGWASGDVVAVSDMGEVVHYDGSAWTSLAFPDPLLQLTGIAGTSGTDLLVGANGGLVFRYDGVRWTPVDAGTTALINAMVTAGDTSFIATDDLTMHRLVRTIAW